MPYTRPGSGVLSIYAAPVAEGSPIPYSVISLLKENNKQSTGGKSEWGSGSSAELV